MSEALRKAAQAALEALEQLDGLDTETEVVTIYVSDEIEALRAALAEPEQSEPLANLIPSNPGELKPAGEPEANMVDLHQIKNREPEQSEPICYLRLAPGGWEPCHRGDEGANALFPTTAAPPRREPLTTEKYTELAHRIASTYAHRSDPKHIAYTFLPHTLEQFVRSLEAAHGITGGKDD